MDPRERADAALARARARGAFVVTPDDAVSPMDAASTVQIPRAVVRAADEADSTMVIPGGVARGARPQQQGHPAQQGYPQQGRPMPQPGQQQGYPPQRGHQTGPHHPVPYANQQQQQQPPQQQAQQQGRQEPQQYEDQPTPRQLDGLVPTTQQPGTQRSMMARRLDGQ